MAGDMLNAWGGDGPLGHGQMCTPTTGRTPLMFAMRHGNEITARWMVANGADVKAQVTGSASAYRRVHPTD